MYISETEWFYKIVSDWQKKKSVLMMYFFWDNKLYLKYVIYLALNLCSRHNLRLYKKQMIINLNVKNN